MSEHEPGLNANFAYCLKKFGLPMGGEAVPPEVLAAYGGRTPSSLRDFWKQCGVGLWLDGRFQLCRPDRYQPILDMILANDPHYPPAESTLLGFTAFGRLLKPGANKAELLMVLERPDIPLHTNGSENDIRCQVTCSSETLRSRDQAVGAQRREQGEEGIVRGLVGGEAQPAALTHVGDHLDRSTEIGVRVPGRGQA